VLDDHRVSQRQLEREGVEGDFAETQVVMLSADVVGGLRTDEPRHAPEAERRVRREGEDEQRRHQDERCKQHFAQCSHAPAWRTAG
jgi:hypothetical protein